MAIDTIIQRDTLHKAKPNTGKKGKPVKGAKPVSAAKDTSSKSNSRLESMVKWSAEDSTYTDNDHNIMYLYGKARVTYEDFELDADFIRVDQKNHQIFAKGRIDPRTHRYVGRPITKQRNDKPAAADSIYYNYETKKGKVFNPASEQGGNFVSGGLAKKLNENEVAYHNVLYSTCDLPYPDTHFGIVITKGIAEKNQIVSGPAYLEIEGVPLPLAIPFGFFPKPNTRASGVILPTFGEDQQRGFYLQNFGYYVGINDNIDLTTTGSIYTKGSYEIGTTARYIVRYQYTGTARFDYASNNYGNPGDPARKTFNILWSHSQDPSAHPGSVFSASVNAGSSSYYSNSGANQNYNLQQITQNNLHSSIAYSKTWAGSPFNLSVNLTHSQDLAKKTVDLELPSFTFNMASISPFDSKDRVGEQKWYQKITISYNSSGTNKVSSLPEDELFQGDILAKRLQTGFKQNIPVSLSLTFLKFFQFSTNFNYTEYWNIQSINEKYDRTSLTGSNLIIDTIPGFKRAGEYTLGASVSTKVYGTMNFKGKLKAIRHVMTPSLSFNYRPDFGDPSYGYYKTAVSQASVPYPYQATSYSIFNGTAVGGPSPGKQAGIGFSLDNTIEAKVRAKSTDTSQTDKKIQILQGLTFSTFYNFAADSMKLSLISFSGHTAIFNQKLNISFGGVFDPYVVNVRDTISGNQIHKYAQRIDRYTWQNGQFPRLTSFFASTDISLNSNAKTGNRLNPNVQNGINNTLAQGLTPEQAERLALVSQDQSAFVDFNVPWNINLSYSFNYTNNVTSTSVTNTIQARGDVNITPKWKVTYYSDLDIRKQKVSTCQLGIYRDLHCWDLAVQWIPFGYLKMYSVMLRVKASILQDLKLSKRSDYTNNQYYNPYY
ncbi:putative LPS assembly protein LptD [Mucilaginibacter jinjuensis]|uniref:LPS assembly protein LptD n=1 Tax=Mucilaginibacter jinjuensis TaxID=1176721 RepID=A0ABY7T2A6_9SPHI|nr:putative LPS assembly protein LptD [Mucilaginibacter jinjuensis]WCT09953.1 putative LPS assembly protein LptD [Mucilaginibacter jinjuensis]